MKLPVMQLPVLHKSEEKVLESLAIVANMTILWILAIMAVLNKAINMGA